MYNILTVKQLKDMLRSYPDDYKIFVNPRTEFIDEVSPSDLKVEDVKLYKDEEFGNVYGIDNKDGEGKPFKALIIEL
ncbi:hypothetical protein JOC34_000520 [Virgibacillus halotolerans]|uniref:hypothetical protein n=1 Tax=Virgibacillus halotolerans TaxID=1071053 RepID=UPI0019607DB0|nr:hypothetical protein [Virgibacillus halotolerans]MBM7598163.1 hypothetical protein [Virgibacillus halotolerans]